MYEQRDRTLDQSDVPQLPPRQWAQGMVGKYYRPLKSQISFRVDKDVLAWLKSSGAGHLSRISRILREWIESERTPLSCLIRWGRKASGRTSVAADFGRRLYQIVFR